MTALAPSVRRRLDATDIARAGVFAAVIAVLEQIRQANESALGHLSLSDLAARGTRRPGRGEERQAPETEPRAAPVATAHHASGRS